ncbi:type II toxin-antitoxin system PemK/MazF family toxin [Corynebacterium durum]|uniref:type II toxin-antitoxin system PemK/MazF family toxin n=1 Tax=Corynebacterium durum TaxID=61592 RepID=UPI0036F3CA85
MTVIPVTSTNRGWANHVPAPTLGPDSVAMTEHIHTISRSRITKYGSCVDEESLDNMRMWIRDFLI